VFMLVSRLKKYSETADTSTEAAQGAEA
jgi:hypothetical protein